MFVSRTRLPGLLKSRGRGRARREGAARVRGDCATGVFGDHLFLHRDTITATKVRGWPPHPNVAEGSVRPLPQRSWGRGD